MRPQSIIEAYGPEHVFNMTHKIETLSFGAQYPGLVRAGAAGLLAAIVC